VKNLCITQSRYEGSLEQFEEERALSEGKGLMFVLAEVGTAVTLAQMGRRDEAREVRDRLVAHARQAYVSPYCLSWLYFSWESGKRTSSNWRRPTKRGIPCCAI